MGFYTLTHAMVISGLDEETIVQAGKSDYFEMNPLTKLIDPESFTYWLERRNMQRVVDMAEEIRCQHVQIYAQMGHMRRQIASLEDRLKRTVQPQYGLRLL